MEWLNYSQEVKYRAKSVCQVYTMGKLRLISSTAQSKCFLNIRLGVGVSHQSLSLLIGRTPHAIEQH